MAIPTKAPFAVGAGRPFRFGIVRLLTSHTERGKTKPEAMRGAIKPIERSVVKETI